MDAVLAGVAVSLFSLGLESLLKPNVGVDDLRIKADTLCLTDPEGGRALRELLDTYGNAIPEEMPEEWAKQIRETQRDIDKVCAEDADIFTDLHSEVELPEDFADDIADDITALCKLGDTAYEKVRALLIKAITARNERAKKHVDEWCERLRTAVTDESGNLDSIADSMEKGE